MALPEIALMGLKGQISFFIILGIFILMIGGLGMYYLSEINTPAQEDISKQTAGNLDQKVFETFLNSCLEKSSATAIWRMGKQGGYLGLNNLDLRNSIPFGVHTQTKIILPVWANLDTCIALRGDLDGDGDRELGCSGSGDSVEINPFLLDTNTVNDNGQRSVRLRLMQTPTNPVPVFTRNEKIMIDGHEIGVTENWNGMIFPTLEQMEHELLKYSFALFEQCVQDGIGQFKTYADITLPVDSTTDADHDGVSDYEESRDIWLADNTIQSLKSEDLGYTTERVKASVSINDNNVKYTFTYPIIARDAKTVITINDITATHDVHLKRAYKNAKGFVEHAVSVNMLALGNPELPSNIYELNRDECNKFRNAQISDISIDKKTSIVVIPTDLRESLMEMTDQNAVLGTSGGEQAQLAACPYLPENEDTYGCREGSAQACEAVFQDTNIRENCENYIDDLEHISAMPTSSDIFTEYTLVRFMDNKPQQLKYNSPFIFQFAIKNINVRGRC